MQLLLIPARVLLAPCPFCGGKVIARRGGELVMIVCEGCGAVVSFQNMQANYAKSGIELAEAWNKRKGE